MSLLDTAKELAAAYKKAGDIEHYEKIIDLQSNILEIMEENDKLKKKISELEDQIEIKGKMTYRNPFWYMENDDIPFCPRCWEGEKKTIHLTTHNNKSFYCPECKNPFSLKSDRELRTIQFGR